MGVPPKTIKNYLQKYLLGLFGVKGNVPKDKMLKLLFVRPDLKFPLIYGMHRVTIDIAENFKNIKAI